MKNVMKKMGLAVSVVMVAAGLSLTAAETAEKKDATAQAVVTAQASGATTTKKPTLSEVYDKKFGGRLIQPGSQQGSVVFVNGQSALGEAEFAPVVKEIKRILKIEVKVVGEKPRTGMPRLADVKASGASAAVFVMSDPALPVLLAAPEERWALVNVAAMAEGLPSGILGEAMMKTRFRSELWRGFALACGGQSSMSSVSVFNAPDMASLDTTDASAISYDVVQRAGNYLRNALKVTPPRIVTYRIACQEGWAPAPTNDVQRTIWNQVHAIPDKPIKIEFDPKRDK